MTERERVCTSYDKIQKKHSYPLNEIQINRFALQAEQRKTIWKALGFLWAGMLCIVLWLLPSNAEWFNTIQGFCICLYVATTFEYFRTVLNASKIKAHYRYDFKEPYQGILTYNRIIADIQPSHCNQQFKVVKAILYDKDDRDSSSVSFIFHKYRLFFQLEDHVTTFSYRIKRSSYLKAPLNAPYFLVLSDNGTVLTTYVANEWQIGADLFGLCDFDAVPHNIFIQNSATMPMPVGSNRIYTGWHILLLILHFVCLCLPVLIDLCVLPAMSIFVINMAVKDKNTLSFINILLNYVMLTISIILLFL